LSAAANAAGYLYASGKLSESVRRRQREERLADLTKHFIEKKNVSPARAAELAQEALGRHEQGRKRPSPRSGKDRP
jgi:predicted HTH domain antitoxin